jgi:hypothetical protein
LYRVPSGCSHQSPLPAPHAMKIPHTHRVPERARTSKKIQRVCTCLLLFLLLLLLLLLLSRGLRGGSNRFCIFCHLLLRREVAARAGHRWRGGRRVHGSSLRGGGRCRSSRGSLRLFRLGSSSSESLHMCGYLQKKHACGATTPAPHTYLQTHLHSLPTCVCMTNTCVLCLHTLFVRFLITSTF